MHRKEEGNKLIDHKKKDQKVYLMRNYPIPEEPMYSNMMRMLETTDLVHADLFNALYAQLLENDEYLRVKEDEHILNKSNPHGLTKEQIGLSRVDNSADMEKPISTAQQNALNEKADLGTDGKVSAAQLPSYVNNVLEYSSKAEFPGQGETGKLYVTRDTNLTYRWTGSGYVEISKSLSLGTTSSTAYRGDWGERNRTDIAAIIARIEKLEAAQYPVGSIIQTTKTQAQFDPNKTLGGTWKLLQGVFLFGANANRPITNNAKDGGEETHKLSIAEMPSHQHAPTNGGLFMSSGNATSLVQNFSAGEYKRYAASMTAAGGGSVHNNMPPYKSVNIWERTA